MALSFLAAKASSIRILYAWAALGTIFFCTAVIALWHRQTHAQGACTVTVTSFPFTMNQAGAVYCLDRDLTNVGSGISITADNVTFDGQGHSVAFQADGSGNMPNVFSIDYHDYVTIKNFSFTGTGRVVAKTIQFTDAHHNTVDSVTGVLTNGSNQAGDSLTFMVFFESYGNTIRNSTFMVHYAPNGAATNAGRVIYLRNNSAYNTFENNTIVSMDHGSSYAIEMGSGSWGVVHQNMFRGNRVYVNNGNGILMQSGSGHNLFERNLVYSASGAAIDTSNADGNANNEYFNNTLIAAAGKSVNSQTGTNNPSHTFKNNILVSGNAFAVDMHAATLVSDYNNFYRTSGSGLIWFSGTTYTALSNWQGTGRDIHSASVSPSFVDSTVNVTSYPPILGDFHLTAIGNAALLGTGENGVDMGAFPRDRSCTENWTCDAFTTCDAASQAQYRVCHDTNYCGTTTTRPTLSQSCSGSCVESWSCGAWSSCSNNTQTRTCTDSYNCGTITDRPALSQSCDSTAPTISIISPTIGATVSGTITVSANAADSGGIAGVQFQLDGVNLGTEDAAAPYALSWNTTNAVDGTHTLTAIARDAAGNTATATAVTVTTNNALSCVESWSCGDWSSCTNGAQSRTCTDAKTCGTTVNRPAISQSCDSVAPAAVSDLR